MSKLSMLLGMALLALFLAGGMFALRAFSHSPPIAVAQSGDEPGGEETAGPLVPLPVRDFFQPYPAGPGEIPYEELHEFDKTVVEKQLNWEADHGDAVHQAWRGASEAGIAYAALKHAEREAALQGIDSLGVEP